VEAVDEQGAIMLDQTIERLQCTIRSAQGVMLEYDSAAKKEPEGLAKMVAPMFQSMVGKPFKMKMTARGDLKEVKLPQGMLESLSKIAGSQIGNLVSEDSMKQFGMLSVFPEGPIAPGQSWSHETTMKNPILGRQEVKSTFRYLGTETRDSRTLDKIELSMKIQSQGKKAEGEKEGEKKTLPENQPPSPSATLPQAGEGSKPAKPEGEKPAMLASLSAPEGKGLLLFDNQDGRLVESTMEMKMNLEMTVMGQKISQEMNLKMKMTPRPDEAASGEDSKEK
jgi:hypothetical protein